MIIFLPFQPKTIGGTSTFAIKFKDVMTRLGHEVHFNQPTKYDLLFLIVQAPFNYLYEAKRKGIKIVQRLDGVYYWTIAKSLFPLYNAKSALTRHLFSDYSIYQSDYCQRVCNQFLGPSLKPYSIIMNGVDLKMFNPTGSRINLKKNSGELTIFNASEFRYRHQIDPIFAAVNKYRQNYNPNCRLLLAGSFSGEVKDYPGKLQGENWVNYLGPLKNSYLPQYERSSDLFIFSHNNPPCPNNIIEAMASGLPICGIADGSMPELCHHNLNSLLLRTKQNGYWATKRIDIEHFAKNIHKISANLKSFSLNSRRIAEEKFSLETMGKKYENTFLKIING